MPVTSGAPSHTTSSASRASSPSRKTESTFATVSLDVMSPCSRVTPSIGAISWRSMATMRTSEADDVLANSLREST